MLLASKLVRVMPHCVAMFDSVSPDLRAYVEKDDEHVAAEPA